ncbi:MAG: ABC transporter permease [Clostridiales bacterium]|jgi:simple sugar transport system permease protein|nr:ABC transporter permease [Clostridiales bacterium]
MGEKILGLIGVLAAAARFGAPLLFGTTGAILNEKSGNLNLGVEGTMSVGAIGGYLMMCYSGSVFIGLSAAFFFAALCGLIYSFLTVSLKANQNVTGLAMTIFGVGLCQFVGQTLKSSGKFPAMTPELFSALAENGIPRLKDIPYIGKLLFSYNLMVYIAVAVAVVCWVYIAKTRAGLKMRAVGENPAAADSVGVNVSRVKYANILVGSGIMGLGGFYMGAVIFSGAWNDTWTSGYGWISVALVIFASWSPAKAVFGSFIFGIMIVMQSQIGVLTALFPAALNWMTQIPLDFYQMLPFLVTAVILIVNSMRKSKSGNAPAAVGLNYFREER